MIYEYNTKKVFLGGTCNNSTWRDEIIKEFDKLGINYFNPVVDDWNEEAQKNEEIQKHICSVNLYVITSEMTGVYSIAEVVDSSNKMPTKTVLCILLDGFDENQIKSLKAVGNMVVSNGSKYTESLEETVQIIANMR